MVNYIIPAKANELVKRLVQILIGPFSKYQTHQDTNELLALLQERKAAIEDVIKIALEFKKNIILGVRAYQVIDIEPGTPFDKRMMEDDGAGVGQVPGGTPESARVKLCLSPGLFFLHNSQANGTEETETRSNWGAALTQRSISIRRYSGHGTDPPGVVLCKAVVLL